MDPKLLKLLTDLGLGTKQARVYLALLVLGEGTVKAIAEKSSVKRTTVYVVLEQLRHQGLVHHTKVDKHTYYLPEEPADLLEIYKNKIDRFSKQVILLNEIRQKSSHRPRVFFFNGEEGFKEIWKMLFKSRPKEYLIITDPREMLHFVRKGYITGKIIKEKVRLGIKSRQLIVPSEYSKEILAKDLQENRVSKVLPYNQPVSYTTIIFEDKVALISPFVEDLILIIDSQEFAKSERALFESLWQVLPVKIS
jgi:sugar-specific transcriptional regulator TrmB